ncbi:hypothetical protein BBJ28_00012089 [Nothophytophthora sp. Chile5]|nr:hypothetical protein BBJ28_00012089 [Nothophytophthora sp. Chile5]
MLSRRRSSRLDEEWQAVERQVEVEFTQQQQLAGDGASVGLMRRKSSGYLPANLEATDSNLRVAKHVIQKVYSLYERYERLHAIEDVACGVAMSEASKFALRAVNAVLTALLLGLVCWRFVKERDILIRRNVLPPDVSYFRMPKQLLQLALELAICAIFVPPGTSGSFDVREWKFYTTAPATGGVGSGVSGQKDACGAPFVVQDGSCYLEYSYPYHTSYLGTLHRVDTMSPLFAVKCFLQSHPFRLLLAAFLGTLVLTTYALAIVEAPVNPNLAPISNALWLVVLTMATVGYGDIVPVTVAGQVLLTFGGMLTGILLIGALVRCTSY